MSNKENKRNYAIKIDNEKAWRYAVGMAQVDGTKPSPELLELIEQEKRGEITTEEIERILCEKYRAKEN